MGGLMQCLVQVCTERLCPLQPASEPSPTTTGPRAGNRGSGVDGWSSSSRSVCPRPVCRSIRFHPDTSTCTKGPSVSTTTSDSCLKSEIETEKKKKKKPSLSVLEDLQNMLYDFYFVNFLISGVNKNNSSTT